MALKSGLIPVIEAVLARPEDALENTFKRFHELGRGAGIDVMARIQEGTLPGVRAPARAFDDRLTVLVHDLRYRSAIVTWQGDHGMRIWQEGLANGSVRQRLVDHLERLRAAGAVSDDCHRQAIGLPPLAGIHGLAGADERGGGGNARE